MPLLCLATVQSGISDLIIGPSDGLVLVALSCDINGSALATENAVSVRSDGLYTAECRWWRTKSIAWSLPLPLASCFLKKLVGGLMEEL